MKIKKIVFLLIAILGSVTVHATPFQFTGKVKTLNAANREKFPNSPLINSVEIEGLTQAGVCGKQANGNVLLRLPNDTEVYSTLLAAKMASASVYVSFDDADREPVWNTCILYFVSLI